MDARSMLVLASCAVAVGFAPLALGSTHYWSMLTAAALVAVSGLAAQALLVPQTKLSTPAGVLMMGSLAMVCATGLQLVPLPFEWLSTLTPAGEVHANAHAALDLPHPVAVPASMAPGETGLALVRDASLAVCLFIGLIGGERKLRSGMQKIVALSGASVALLALAHHVASANAVYGIYRPIYANPSILSPLLNANHLAGLMVLTVPIMLELAVRATHTRTRWTWTGLAACSAAACSLTYSRAGVTCLAVAVTIVGSWGLWATLWRRRSRRSVPPPTRHYVAPTALVVACLLAAAGFSGASVQAEHRLASGTDKLQNIGEAMAFAANAPLVGVGRGAYSSARAMKSNDHATRQTHPENLLAQWCSDWGAPLAVLWLGILCWWTWRAGKHLLRRGSLRNVGAFIGVVFLALHNMFDFSLELLGVGIPAALSLGTVAGLPDGAERQVPRWSAAVLGFGLLGVTIGVWQWSPAKPSYFLARRMADPALEDRAFQRLLRHATLGHPAEPSFALLAARRARGTATQDVPRWLNRGMQLAPEWVAPHLEAATWLLERSRPSQAVLELRMAASLDPAATSSFVCKTQLFHRDAPDLVLNAEPRGARGVEYLEHLSCLPWSSPLLARVDARLLELAPKHLGANVRTARRLRKQGRPEAALERLMPLLDPAAPNRDLVREMVSCWLASGRLWEAKSTLEALALESRPELERALYPSIVQVAYQLDPQRGEAALRRWRAAIVANSREFATTFQLEGHFAELAGEHENALAAYERAYRLTKSDRVLRDILRVAARQGKVRRVAELCRRLAEAPPRACTSAAAGADDRSQRPRYQTQVRAAQPLAEE